MPGPPSVVCIDPIVPQMLPPPIVAHLQAAATALAALPPAVIAAAIAAALVCYVIAQLLAQRVPSIEVEPLEGESFGWELGSTSAVVDGCAGTVANWVMAVLPIAATACPTRRRRAAAAARR